MTSTLRVSLALAISERTWRYWNVESPADLEVLAPPLSEDVFPAGSAPSRWSMALQKFLDPEGVVATVLTVLFVILDLLALLHWARHLCRKRWKAGVDAKDSAMSSHAECQTFECDFSCTRCELKSRELDKVLGELLTEQKKAVSRSTEVQEARSQLTGARERLVELGSEVREQKLQNSVQAQRLERALKEWNSSETERRRSECQVRVLEQELDKLRQEVCHLRLQVSCARAADAESTEQKTTAPTVPPVPLPVSRTPAKRVSLPGAVMNKARHLEEKIREDSSRASLPVTQERGEVKRSPNTQMREKMAQARRRLEQKMPEAEPASELPRPGEPEQDSQAKVSTTSRSLSNSTTSLSPRNASEIPI